MFFPISNVDLLRLFKEILQRPNEDFYRKFPRTKEGFFKEIFQGPNENF